MDIVLIDDSNIDEMVRIWNANKVSLSEIGSDDDVTVESLEKWREKDPIEFYGVIVDEDIHDELGGFFVLSEKEDVVILEHMAIDEAYKRKGVGDAILRHCKYQARTKFDNNLKLHIYTHNYVGINFFFATGFEIDGYDSEEQKYTMVLKD